MIKTSTFTRERLLTEAMKLSSDKGFEATTEAPASTSGTVEITVFPALTR